jgi:hypothetical protein
MRTRDQSTPDEFSRLVNKIISQGIPLAGADLHGMIADFHHALEASPLLSKVKVRKTGEPARMIAAFCEPASLASSPSELVAEVERIWMEELRYNVFEAHTLVPSEEEVILDCLTMTEPQGPYVTARIVVDLRKLDRSVRPVSFWYQLFGAGWGRAGISDGQQDAQFLTSYLSDPLGDLASGISTLLQGASKARCAWAEEPGEWRWLFDRHGDEVEIRILWFEDTFSKALDEKGELRYSTRCRLLRLASQVRDSMRQLLDEVGLDGYREAWRYDFPVKEYERLNALIESRS